MLTAEQAASADKFLNALQRVSDWESLEIGKAAQRVQRYVIGLGRFLWVIAKDGDEAPRILTHINSGFRLPLRCAMLGGEIRANPSCQAMRSHRWKHLSFGEVDVGRNWADGRSRLEEIN